MLHPAIDDMNRSHTSPHSIERTTDLGQHTSMYGAVGNQSIDFRGRQARQQLPLFVEQTGGIGEQHQLFRL